jgi:hypothetical protein
MVRYDQPISWKRCAVWSLPISTRPESVFRWTIPGTRSFQDIRYSP